MTTNKETAQEKKDRIDGTGTTWRFGQEAIFKGGSNLAEVSPEVLMEQATWTTAFYMEQGQGMIDHQFGEGYCKEHPELLAAFINACAQDLHTGMITTRAHLTE